jgi:hypothetical protein
MNRIGKKLLILSLLLLSLFLTSSCGNQPDGIVTSPTSSEETLQHATPATEETSFEESAIKEAPAKESAIKEAPAKEPATKETPTEAAPIEEAPKITPLEKEAPEPQSTVTISITGDEKKGVILEPTSIDWQDDDSVLDVLKQVTKSNRIPLEYKGSGVLSYVEGIANLYEFDQGATSGWLFKVNGEFANKSAGAVKLSKGDNVEWIYSLELSEEPDN